MDALVFASIETGKEVARFEECAGCGAYNRLVKRGRLFVQPEHDCDGRKQEESCNS